MDRNGVNLTNDDFKSIFVDDDIWIHDIDISSNRHGVPNQRQKLRITSPLWRQFTRDRWIPLTKAQ